ncbi:MAG: ABC transporter ATP-binding protein, partial [Desulfobacteraceae bacterium]
MNQAQSSHLFQPEGNAPLRLELKGMTKIYPSVVANDSIDLQVAPGEIHAILGENGAGKSTLMKAIYGVVKPDQGEILWEGRPITVTNPSHARKLGIGMVFQHFSLFETLTVAENISLAMEKRIDMDRLSEEIIQVSERYGLPLDPERLVHSLPVGMRQRVEIVRCLIQNPRLLIMDEPTSVLTPQAVLKMFDTLRQLSSEGCSILYISHKLDEIKALCHRATIIRAGRVTGTAYPADETPSSLARMMIGKELPVCTQDNPDLYGDVCLEVTGLSRTRSDQFGTDLCDIRFSINSGEILGIAGISGNGQRELINGVVGEWQSRNPDEVKFFGKPVGHLDTGQRRDIGLGFVPEDRLGRGAVPGMSLVHNYLLTCHRHNLVKNGLIRFGHTARMAGECIDRFDVRCGGVDDQITSLSGGNVQKFITGREILQKPKLIVVSQPTWGVDVGAANVIRQSIIDLRNQGTAVLVISEELDELFEICDRLMVIAQGYLSPSLDTCDTSKEEIGIWMSGMFPGGPA